MTPVFQSGTAPCSRLPRLDPISTVEDRPGGPLVAVGWNRGLRRPCQDVRMPALGVSAIDEICEHTARFRIPVDIALATWRLEAVSVSFARPLRPLARLWRPSLGVARRAIAFFSGGWGLRPLPIVSLAALCTGLPRCTSTEPRGSVAPSRTSAVRRTPFVARRFLAGGGDLEKV